MQLSGSWAFEADRPSVWVALNDPAVLQAATPGCKELIPIGPDEWAATLQLGLAGIKGNYKGQIRLADKVEPERFSLLLAARGAPGIVQARVEISLAETEGGTSLTYLGEAQVGGPVAGIGQRLLGGAAKLLLGQFFAGIAQQLTAGVERA
jgi:carbon monoxide dehydrogenase subunit G